MKHLSQIVILIACLIRVPMVIADLSPMQKHAQVDVVSLSKDGKTIVLSLVEIRAWDEKGQNVLDMQEKIKNYLNYIESGQLYRQYPEAEGKSLRFRLDTVYPPDALAEKFIGLAKELWLSPMSIEWEMGLLRE